MRSSFPTARRWIVFAIAAFLPRGFGGTVITENLPADTAIINIDARQDGSLTYNGDQSLWYHPFNANGAAQLLTYVINPGTYTFRIINSADAARMFPLLTQAQTNLIYSAWTYNAPWVTDYLVFDGAATNDFTIPQLFDGSPDPTGYPNADAAYSGAVTNGFYDAIRAGPEGRDGKTLNYSYNTPISRTLVFAIPDPGLFDNGGGVSVLVSPAGPALTILRGQSTIDVPWPASQIGFSLEQNPQLGTPAWTPVNINPVMIGTNFSVTVDVDSTSKFFRLRRP